MRLVRNLMKTGKYSLLFLMALVLLGGCAAFTPPPPMVQTGMDDMMREAVPDQAEPDRALPPLTQLEPQVAMEEKLPFEEMLFSLSARNTPLREVLMGLSQEAGLNLIIERGVNPADPVSFEMKDIPLRTALDTLLSSYDYFYVIEGNILRVKAFDTKIFYFNYPLFVNEVTSSVGGDMLGSSEGAELSGKFEISSEVKAEDVTIWDQIEEALQARGTEGGILSAEGYAQINRLSGTIMVTDRRRYLEQAEKYLQQIELSLGRQVVLEAKILEVTLNESHKYGINWQAVARSNSGNTTLTLNTQNALAGTGPLQMFGFAHANATGTFALTNTFVDMLSSQGSVNVLSSPRVSVLNNQSAMINVGSTLPYLDWQVETTTDPTTGNAVTTIVPRVATAQEGISLGVTAQIDEDDVTTLHISPVITDSNGTQAFTYNGNTWTVPIIDMRASDTIVRVRSGETIVLGGLIKENLTGTKDSVTGLGNIPILGDLLFSGHNRVKQKQELVILLTPTVITR